VDEARIFNDAVTAYGGRLDTDRLPAAAGAGLDRVAQRARGFLRTASAVLPKLPPIHFDFVDNWGFNARAFRSGGRYFIGIYRGAVVTLNVLFDRMLADPAILPFIGDPSEERADLPLLPALGLDAVQSFGSVPLFPRPRDPARRATTVKLTELALDFLTAHEFAHVANGHLDYMTENLGISAIDEIGEPSRGSEVRKCMLANQTMEMDADATAVVLNLSSEWGKVVGTFPRPGPEWDYVYDRPGIVSAQWAWAVLMLFRLFGEVRLVGGDVTLEPYPRPRLRSVMVQRAAGRTPRPWELREYPALVGDDLYKIPATIQAAQPQVEEMISQVTGRPDATKGLDDAWGAVGEAQMRRLLICWQSKLRVQLLKLAYQPLSSHGDLVGRTGDQ
jgi:hypothetical protein